MNKLQPYSQAHSPRHSLALRKSPGPVADPPTLPNPPVAQAAAPSLQPIQAAARQLAAARCRLAVALASYRDQVNGLRREHQGPISGAAAAAEQCRLELEEALRSAPELFISPRVQVFEGIEVGYRKRAGSVRWEDELTVLARIKKQLPAQASLLIQTRETPNKTALRLLSPGQLQRLGCLWDEGGDTVVIRPGDELDGQLKAWQSDALEPGQSSKGI